jgi:hypothetical protein
MDALTKQITLDLMGHEMEKFFIDFSFRGFLKN